MKFIATMLLVLAASCSMLLAQAPAGNYAKWEVWNNTDGSLNKLSEHLTDSVTVIEEGASLTLRFEARQEFRGRPTRRLQITIPNFRGPDLYTLQESPSTFWEVFTPTEKCGCVRFTEANPTPPGTLPHNVRISKYNPVSKDIEGTFSFRCQSKSAGGQDLLSRVRFGEFRFSRLSLTANPKDTLVIAELQADTVVNVTLTATMENQPKSGIKIIVLDQLKNPTPFPDTIGVTDAAGVLVYPIRLPKSTPGGDYNFKWVAVVPGSGVSDTARFMIRYGSRFYEHKCLGLTLLTFDAGEGKQWKPINTGSKVLSAQGPVKVSPGGITLSGNVQIDPSTQAVLLTGPGAKVVIDEFGFRPQDVKELDISDLFPLGTFILPNCDGILQFASKKLGTRIPPKISFEIEQLRFINRPDAKGLAFKGKITASNLNSSETGCDPVVDTTGDFITLGESKKSLSVGFTVTNRLVENLSLSVGGISIPFGICVNQIAADFDFLQERYGISGKVQFPWGGSGQRVGLSAGVLLMNNPRRNDESLHLDSIRVGIDVDACVPLGTSPFCFKALNLSTSGLSNPDARGLKLRSVLTIQSQDQRVLQLLPRIAEILGDPKLAEIDLLGEYEHPAIFTGAVTLKLMQNKKISPIRPWQVEGNLTGKINFNGTQTFSGSYKAIHLGGPDNMLNVSGSFTFPPLHSLNFGYSATAKGSISYPKPGPEVLDMPVVGDILSFLMNLGAIPATFGTGDASMMLSSDKGFLVSSVIDVSQNPVESIRRYGRMGFVYKFDGEAEYKIVADPVGGPRVNKSGDEVQQAKAIDTIRVDATVEKLFVLIVGETVAPVSRIKAPDGTVHAGSSADSSVAVITTPNGKMAQWYIDAPAPGAWVLELESPGPSDRVNVFVNRKPVPFEISATNTSRSVTVNWTPIARNSDDIVRVYVDEDGFGDDGLYVGEAAEMSGLFTFELPEFMTECTYRIHATRIAGTQPIVTVYAPETIGVAGPSVAIPPQITATSNQTGATMVRWTMQRGSAVAGFLIYVRDVNGADSLFANVESGDRAVELQIENHEGKRVFMRTYDADGIRSCPTEAINITTSVHERDVRYTTSAGSMLVAPNPANDRVRISVQGGTATGSLEIVDLLGLYSLNVPVQPATGEAMVFDVDISALPTGSYIARLRTDRGDVVGQIKVVR